MPHFCVLWVDGGGEVSHADLAEIAGDATSPPGERRRP
jgi:hypothetical protein